MSVKSKTFALLALATTGCVAPQPPPARPSVAAVEQARALAPSPAAWPAECANWDEWEKPAPPFRIHGDTYHIGTCGISSILVAGPQGHVLLDTGTRNGAGIVLENVRALGIEQQNIRAVLTSHEHFDHVGGLWWLNQNTGARVFTSPEAADVITSGASDPEDPQHGMHVPMRPLSASLVTQLAPDQPVKIAGLTFTPIATPGHTPGALSWQWQSCEGAECLSIVFADSLSPVSRDDYRFSDHPEYLAAYRAGIARLAALDCDILLTPHPSASGMRDKLLGGDLTTGPTCRDYAADIAARLDARLAEEAGAAR